jgi:hypothetical protein
MTPRAAPATAIADAAFRAGRNAPGISCGVEIG